jgi:DNA-binding MarR family transcriptional regulator
VAGHVASELESATGLPLEWFETLLHIYAADEARVQQQDLGRYSGLSQSAISRMVSKMQDGGLIRREQMPEDRRNLFVLLTDAGRDALLRAPEQFFRANWSLHRAISAHCRNNVLREISAP